jgi:hypothetical protein
MIEVFKTNVETIDDSKLVLEILTEKYPETTMNFDLDDCDNILRVEGNNLIIEQIISIIMAEGFYCEVLPD